MRFIIMIVLVILICHISPAEAVEQVGMDGQIFALITQSRAESEEKKEAVYANQHDLYKWWANLSLEKQADAYESFVEKDEDFKKNLISIRESQEALEQEIVVGIIQAQEQNKIDFLNEVEDRIDFGVLGRIKMILLRSIPGLVVGIISATIVLCMFWRQIQNKMKTYAASEKKNIIEVAEHKAKEILERAQLRARRKSNDIMAEARNVASEVNKKASLNGQKEQELKRWEQTLAGANQKLSAMKESHLAAEKKIHRTLKILKSKYPESAKHFRYIMNKANEMTSSYKMAKKCFERISAENS